MLFLFSLKINTEFAKIDTINCVTCYYLANDSVRSKLSGRERIGKDTLKSGCFELSGLAK